MARASAFPVPGMEHRARPAGDTLPGEWPGTHGAHSAWVLSPKGADALRSERRAFRCASCLETRYREKEATLSEPFPHARPHVRRLAAHSRGKHRNSTPPPEREGALQTQRTRRPPRATPDLSEDMACLLVVITRPPPVPHKGTCEHGGSFASSLQFLPESCCVAVCTPVEQMRKPRHEEAQGQPASGTAPTHPFQGKLPVPPPRTSLHPPTNPSVCL